MSRRKRPRLSYRELSDSEGEAFLSQSSSEEAELDDADGPFTSPMLQLPTMTNRPRRTERSQPASRDQVSVLEMRHSTDKTVSKVSEASATSLQRRPSRRSSSSGRKPLTSSTPALERHPRERARKSRKVVASESEEDQQEDEDYEEDEDLDDDPCAICDVNDEPMRMLLCDGCNRPFHMSCLVPPLKSIPRGDWFCDECCKDSKGQRNSKQGPEKAPSWKKRSSFRGKESDDEDEGSSTAGRPGRGASLRYLGRSRPSYAEVDSGAELGLDGLFSESGGAGSSSSPESDTVQKNQPKRARTGRTSTSSAKRRSKPQTSSEDEETGESSDGDVGDLVIDRVLGWEKHDKASWTKLMQAMNTKYVKDGTVLGDEGKETATAEGDRDDGEPFERYLIKWKGLAYIHISWESKSAMERLEGKRALQKIEKYFSRCGLDQSLSDEYFSPEYVEVDRVLDEKRGSGAKTVLFYVKWKGLGYDECTWEAEDDVTDPVAIEQYRRRNQLPTAKSKCKLIPRIYRQPKNYRKYEDCAIPHVLNGNQLREYQLDGLNWMIYNWYHGRNSCLADEMGLGKTVQALTFVNHLIRQEKAGAPCLVVVPLSVVRNWAREFAAWTDLNVVVYHGSAAAREAIRKYEFYYKKGSKKVYKFDVLITSPEMCCANDMRYLSSIEWQLLVVDEAHRLKNRFSKLAVVLTQSFLYEDCVLLTGTPLQNNTEELWNLLNFIDPEEFDDPDSFTEKYGNLTEEGQLQALHAQVRPYLLRRMKEDVETSLAPKEEVIIEVELTILQKQYYRAIFEKNSSFLARGCKGGQTQSLQNIMMELRKCCNHPYLLKGVENFNLENLATEQEQTGEHLVSSSGKLILLDKLFPKLQKEGHRVLLFSQFKIMLDILEDYLRMRGYSFERIDGSITGAQRQAAIDRYCAPDGNIFVMLLSTRAGGVGINLTAADTVIIYDSDWNPQNDLQAQARCHRIGQTKPVRIYRLLTRKTYEMEMFSRASLKLGLDYAVLHGVKAGVGSGSSSNAKNLSKAEMESLLRNGAYDIFKEEKDGSSMISSKTFCEATIDQILQQQSTTIVRDGKGSHLSTKSTFSTASFVPSEKHPSTELDDPKFWEKVVGLQVPLEQDELMPRRRDRAARPKTYAEVNLDSDQDYSSEDTAGGKKGVRLSKQLESALLTYGYGRWEKIMGLIDHPSCSEDDARLVSCLLVLKLVEGAAYASAKAKAEARKRAAAAAAALSQHHAQNSLKVEPVPMKPEPVPMKPEPVPMKPDTSQMTNKSTSEEALTDRKEPQIHTAQHSPMRSRDNAVNIPADAGATNSDSSPAQPQSNPAQRRREHEKQELSSLSNPSVDSNGGSKTTPAKGPTPRNRLSCTTQADSPSITQNIAEHEVTREQDHLMHKLPFLVTVCKDFYQLANSILHRPKKSGEHKELPQEEDEKNMANRRSDNSDIPFSKARELSQRLYKEEPKQILDIPKLDSFRNFPTKLHQLQDLHTVHAVLSGTSGDGASEDEIYAIMGFLRANLKTKLEYDFSWWDVGRDDIQLMKAIDTYGWPTGAPFKKNLDTISETFSEQANQSTSTKFFAKRIRQVAGKLRRMGSELKLSGSAPVPVPVKQIRASPAHLQRQQQEIALYEGFMAFLRCDDPHNQRPESIRVDWAATLEAWRNSKYNAELLNAIEQNQLRQSCDRLWTIIVNHVDMMASGVEPRPSDESAGSSQEWSWITPSLARDFMSRLKLLRTVQVEILRLPHEKLLRAINQMVAVNVKFRGGTPRFWVSPDHDLKVLQGIMAHGYGEWESILRDTMGINVGGGLVNAAMVKSLQKRTLLIVKYLPRYLVSVEERSSVSGPNQNATVSTTRAGPESEVGKETTRDVKDNGSRGRSPSPEGLSALSKKRQGNIMDFFQRRNSEQQVKSTVERVDNLVEPGSTGEGNRKIESAERPESVVDEDIIVIDL